MVAPDGRRKVCVAPFVLRDLYGMISDARILLPLHVVVCSCEEMRPQRRRTCFGAVCGASRTSLTWHLAMGFGRSGCPQRRMQMNVPFLIGVMMPGDGVAGTRVRLCKALRKVALNH